MLFFTSYIFFATLLAKWIGNGVKIALLEGERNKQVLDGEGVGKGVMVVGLQGFEEYAVKRKWN